MQKNQWCRVPFGHGKGMTVDQLSMKYLRWLAKNIELYGRFGAHVHARIAGATEPPPDPDEPDQKAKDTDTTAT